MTTIKRLENWYFSHCDNDWEHDNKITIHNLDNPGWAINVDLKGTLLEDLRFDSIEYGDSENRDSTWIKCYKQESIFIGLGSYNMLDSILQMFLNWADSNTDTSQWDSLILHLHSEIEIISKEKSIDSIDRLRKVYNEIDKIPTEHPKKRELLYLFNDIWKKQWE